MKQIGVITDAVIKTLKLDIPPDTPVFIGETNIKHIQSKHPEDFKRYGKFLPVILSEPDYVRLNNKDGSIEYVKEFKINAEFVKVAVRVTTKGKYFARSLYKLNTKRVLNFIQKGTLKKLTT